MPEHHTPLISMIAAGLGLAFLLGLLAHRLRISPLVGYLLAGIAVGPFTPGFVGDQSLANELAEIGVILLMFAVGLHFSLNELMSVRRVAVPGAVLQIAVATAMGIGLAWALGWSTMAGVVFGLALSVASTVVLIRALQERRILETNRGRIAVGWLIVEDLAMVLTLVLLPAIGGPASGGGAALNDILLTIAITLAKVAAFVAIMLLGGRRVVPWVLHYAASTGSRELFRLAVYAIALGVAFGAAMLFGVSFALGAFFAGMVLAESPLSQRATEEAMPLRDAFAVLFFVSVGMLFDFTVVLRDPLAVLATVVIIVVGKSLAALLLVRALGHPWATGLTISASLAQIGEFSFILAALGVSMGILPAEGRNLILAGAIFSILLNPLFFAAVERSRRRVVPVPAKLSGVTRPATSGHDVLVGYGRVGSLVAVGLLAAGRRLVVLESGANAMESAQRSGVELVKGNAADPEVLQAANVRDAARLFVAIPEAFEAGQVVEQARAANAKLQIIARAHSDAEVEHLTRLGADLTVMGEREIAERMLDHALQRRG